MHHREYSHIEGILPQHLMHTRQVVGHRKHLERRNDSSRHDGQSIQLVVIETHDIDHYPQQPKEQCRSQQMMGHPIKEFLEPAYGNQSNADDQHHQEEHHQIASERKYIRSQKIL